MSTISTWRTTLAQDYHLPNSFLQSQGGTTIMTLLESKEQEKDKYKTLYEKETEKLKNTESQFMMVSSHFVNQANDDREEKKRKREEEENAVKLEIKVGDTVTDTWGSEMRGCKVEEINVMYTISCPNDDDDDDAPRRLIKRKARFIKKES